MYICQYISIHVYICMYVSMLFLERLLLDVYMLQSVLVGCRLTEWGLCIVLGTIWCCKIIEWLMINAFFIMQMYRLLRLITVRIYTVYSVKGHRDFPCTHTITKDCSCYSLRMFTCLTIIRACNSCQQLRVMNIVHDLFDAIFWLLIRNCSRIRVLRPWVTSSTWPNRVGCIHWWVLV